MSDYSIVDADQIEDAYADEDVPGEFRALTEALGSEQVAVTLMRVPPHSDFEQGTGHKHEQQEEPTKVEDFWEASPEASQG